MPAIKKAHIAVSLILLVAETVIEPVTIKIGRRCKFYQLYAKYKIKFFCLNSVLLILPNFAKISFGREHNEHNEYFITRSIKELC